jgi:hypothetical protein
MAPWRRLAGFLPKIKETLDFFSQKFQTLLIGFLKTDGIDFAEAHSCKGGFKA